MLHYIFQTITFQLLFLIIYDVFLKKETFFNWNRAYLLITPILSLLIPFVKINSFKDVISQEFMVQLPAVFMGDATVAEQNPIQISQSTAVQTSLSTWETLMLMGTVIAGVLLVFKLLKLLKLLKRSTKEAKGKLVMVKVSNSKMAFSFFNYVFIGDGIDNTEKATILKHEMVHIKQKHTFDLLLFELLRIVFWFNPLVYMYQNRIMALHEFIADAQATKQHDMSAYYQNLLSQVFDTKSLSFINPFYKQSLIKNRIIMLQKSKSKQIKLLKYMVLIPVVLGMLIYTSCEKEVYSSEDLSQYSFTISKEEHDSNANSEEIRAKTNKFESFLKSNPNYVGWINFDNNPKTKSYSIHPLEENVPEKYTSEYTEKNSGGELLKIRYNFEILNKSQEITVRKLNHPKVETEEEKVKRLEEFEKKKASYANVEDVPFAFVDQVPVFPGCDGNSAEELKKCLQENVSKHVNHNFNVKIASDLNLEGRQRVNVIFKINKEGEIVDVRSRAPHEALEKEAIRVVKTLPKLKPAMNNGKVVNLLYSLPIIFQVAN
ncbi:energy transducer TonB [Hyunsoonleella sp. SJ7]|uniref:Energy transducer TonB n=1 Tax=Hyunsoonleella aquatilis TaxID=2762758 RepID=A0A923KHP0_9FLAO|nr:M56 family metallopeptidase [Hyunsoonleella aquatilis]MBC3757044.1 energy transducer TonB [Hyunsoonleella aquatilis]